jgi:hypothetical protein
MKAILYFLPVLIILLSGCSHPVKDEFLSKTDSLEQIVVSLKDSLTFAPDDTINYYYQEALAYSQLFERKMMSFPNDPAMAEKFLLFTDVFKTMKKFMKKKDGLSQSLDFCLKQISDLRSDLKSDNNKMKDLKQYYYDEENEVLKLSGKILEGADLMSSSLETYKQLRPYMALLADSLNNLSE